MYRNPNTHAQAIGSAVKAELARSGKSIASLAPILNISRGSVYTRTRGATAFDYVELQLVADYLDLEVVELINSAQKHEGN